jgi:hypothetical protein
MTCIATDQITEAQLIAYADGEGDSATVDHIRRCSHCAERARAYAADQQTLRTLFYRVECPDAHALGEYHLGLLDATEQAAIEAHLETCRLCAAEVEELRSFLDEVETMPTPSPLPQLKRLVAHRLASPPPASAQQTAFALRGAAAPADFYQAEDIKLVVGLEADGMRAGRKMLVGFTTRQGKPLASLMGARVQLRRSGDTLAVERVDDLGNFAFGGLASGKYELVLATDQEQVVIENIVV